jgi:hypothetical protein
MTVCIGALSRASQRYVCVSDFFVTEGASVAYESEVMKAIFAANGWVVAFSGSVSNWTGLREWMRLNEPADLLSLSEAQAFVQEGYEHERNRTRDAHLVRYGLKSSTFESGGPDRLGPSYESVGYALDAVWDLTLLVGGFHGDVGHIFTLDGMQPPINRTAIGFAAIGSGEAIAHATMSRNYNGNEKASMVSALALQAKFASEISPHVGADTMVFSVPADRSQKILFVNPEGVAPIRALWKARTENYDLQFLREARDMFEQAPL